jgi:hypothetical protein
MVSDALMQLQASTTSTATAHSTGLLLPKSSMLRPFYALINYSAAQQASGSGVFTFGVSVSYDNGNSWHPDFIADDKAITLSGTAQAGEFTIPILINARDLVLPGNIADSTHAVQIRADAVLSGSPVTPTITWSAQCVPSPV